MAPSLAKPYRWLVLTPLERARWASDPGWRDRYLINAFRLAQTGQWSAVGVCDPELREMCVFYPDPPEL